MQQKLFEIEYLDGVIRVEIIDSFENDLPWSVAWKMCIQRLTMREKTLPQEGIGRVVSISVIR